MIQAVRKCVVCFAPVLLVGCSSPEPEDGKNDAPNAVVADEPAAEPLAQTDNADASWAKEGDGLRVTKAGFESRKLTWPLTANSALIGCEHPELLWVEANGERYGLNGMGQIHLKLDRFDDVWKFDEEFAAASGVDEVRVTPTDLMNEARRLCD